MSHTHTPGPWWYGGGCFIWALNGVIIAEPRCSSTIPKSQQIANGHILSASLELLAVVKELEASEINWHDTRPYGIRDRLRAAIAKAEGREA